MTHCVILPESNYDSYIYSKILDLRVRYNSGIYVPARLDCQATAKQVAQVVTLEFDNAYVMKEFKKYFDL